MTPTKYNIIIERIPGEKTTESGLILKNSQEPDRAKVISVGPKVDEVEIGDEVLVNWNGAVEIENDSYCIKIEHVILRF